MKIDLNLQLADIFIVSLPYNNNAFNKLSYENVPQYPQVDISDSITAMKIPGMGVEAVLATLLQFLGMICDDLR